MRTTCSSPYRGSLSWGVYLIETPWTGTPWDRPPFRQILHLDRDPPQIETPLDRDTLDRDPPGGTWGQAARQEMTSYRRPPPLNKMTDRQV